MPASVTTEEGESRKLDHRVLEQSPKSLQLLTKGKKKKKREREKKKEKKRKKKKEEKKGETTRNKEEEKEKRREWERVAKKYINTARSRGEEGAHGGEPRSSLARSVHF